MLSPHFYQLILVTQRRGSLSDYLNFIQDCAAAGITALQLREKHATDEFILEFGSRLKDILDPFHIPLIINDRIDLALKLEAAGVHLGQSDASAQLAREKLGADKFIGVSIENLADLKIANPLPLHYVAASAVFPTKNKNNLKTIWGIDGVSRICQQTSHPVVAIGGMDLENTPAVLQAGAKGIAVIGAVHDAAEPAKTIHMLRKIIDSNTQ